MVTISSCSRCGPNPHCGRPSWVNSPYFHIILAYWSNSTFWQLLPVWPKWPKSFLFSDYHGSTHLISILFLHFGHYSQFSRYGPSLYCLETIMSQLTLFPYNSCFLVQLDILATIPSFSRCSPNLYCLQTIMGQLTIFP